VTRSETGGREVSSTDRRSAEIELFSLAGNDGHLREVNAAFVRLIGLQPSEVEGRSLLELVHPDDVPDVAAALGALESGTAEVLLDTRFPRPDGGPPVHLQWVARPVPGTDTWWAAGRDTSAFHAAVAKTADLGARLDLAFGDAGAGMWDLDLRKDRFEWEPEACAVLGVPTSAAPASPADLVALVHADDRVDVAAAFTDIRTGRKIALEARIDGEGSSRHVSVRGKVLTRDRRGRPERAVGILLDVTAEKAMEEQMLRMVMSDALTGIPNRRAFDQALRSELRRCTRDGVPISVLMVDVDNFKRFNDTYGHLVGDDALCAVARALAGETSSAHVLGRFGGEEFAVVLPSADASTAQHAAERLVAAVGRVALGQAPDWQLTVSVGSATWRPDDPPVKPIALLTMADSALYAAKAAGKNVAVGHVPTPA
jgi:diguanylate cyclase (GGDEF)-like protein/PAS domain S-box-containing protein